VVTHQKTIVSNDEFGLSKTTMVFDNKKVTKRIRKGKRSSFAMSLAKLAYLKFGQRPINSANELVTRKWLVKQLDQEKYVDMRTTDKALAIDRAIFLSFIPTIAYNNMKLISKSKTVVDRVDGAITSFGRIFSVRGSSPL
jgi:hypothetical protein